MKIFTLICICLFSAIIINAQKKKSQPVDDKLLYRISGKKMKKPSYLLGTFHLFCKDDVNWGENTFLAIDSSSEIYFEIDLDDLSTNIGGLSNMMMKGNKKLKDLYSEEDYNKVKNFYKDSIGVNISFFENVKPILLSALMYPKMLPCKNQKGIEQCILERVKKQKKEIKGLETMEFQSSIFDKIPYELQAKELLKSIDSFTVYKKSMVKMIEYYKNAQLSKLMENSDKFGNEVSMKDFNDDLLDNRNKNWAEIIPKIVGNKQVLFAVGAAHLPGKNGVINLLRKKGFTVTPLNN